MLAALRPTPRIEFSTQTGYGRSSRVEGGGGHALSGMTDWSARVRWEALEQSTSWSRSNWPVDLALIAGVLAPAGRADPNLNRGLGAWELSLAAVLDRDLSAWDRVGLFVELAPRLPDHALGVERRLGPRILTQFTASHRLSNSCTVSGFSSLRWEGDASLGGHREFGSGTRLWQVGFGATLSPQGSSFRAGFAIRTAPHVSGLDLNANASTAIELSLAYTR